MSKHSCGLIVLEPRDGGLIQPVIDGLEANGFTVIPLWRDESWPKLEFDCLLSYGPMQSMTWAVNRLACTPIVPPMIMWFTEQVPASDALDYHAWLADARFRAENTADRLRSNQRIGRFVDHATKHAGRLRGVGELRRLNSLGILRLVATFSETNRRFLAESALPTAVIPMGYHSSFGERMNVNRDLDVVFLGTTFDRRRKSLVRRLEQELQDRGISFVVKDGSPDRGAVFGNSRSELLSRSKIMLNLMRQPWDDPVFRMLLAAPHEALLVSEVVLPTSIGPFVPDRHFVMSSIDSLGATIAEYVADITRRQLITTEARRFVTEEITMVNMIRCLLDKAHVS